jgi:hypothetical protein
MLIGLCIVKTAITIRGYQHQTYGIGKGELKRVEQAHVHICARLAPGMIPNGAWTRKIINEILQRTATEQSKTWNP